MIYALSSHLVPKSLSASYDLVVKFNKILLVFTALHKNKPLLSYKNTELSNSRGILNFLYTETE